MLRASKKLFKLTKTGQFQRICVFWTRSDLPKVIGRYSSLLSCFPSC